MITSRGLISGCLAVALGIAGAAYGIEEFVLVSASTVVVFLAGAALLRWRALTSRGLEVEIRIPIAEVATGQQAAAELRVWNTGRWPTGPLRVEEPGRRWSVSFPGLSARAHRTSSQAGRADKAGGTAPRTRPRRRSVRAEASFLGEPLKLPGLRRGAQAVVQIAVPTASRGLLTLEPLGLWCEDPFRMFAAEVASTPPAHVLVCPTPELSAAGARTSSGGQGARPPDAAEYAEPEGMQGGYEFRSLRAYVPGDRMTRLHWPAFARSGELAVRDFVEPVSGCVTLLVDLRPSAHGDGSIDAVISRAAGVGLSALRSGELVELCTSAGERLEIFPGSVAQQDLLRALAVLGPATAPRSVARRLGGTAATAVWAPANSDVSEVVLFTTRIGANSALPRKLANKAETVVV